MFTDLLVLDAGRIYGKRRQGKLIFYDLKPDGAKIQIMPNIKYDTPSSSPS